MTGIKATSEKTLLIVAMASAVLARLAFWVVTNRTWEDALITTIHAINAVEGLGLTHHPGEGNVHGFTSAISVLIPLAAEFTYRGSGILALKLTSLFAGALTIYAAHLISRELSLGMWPRLFLFCYLAFCQTQILFGMAGMETQVAVAVLLFSALYVMRGNTVFSGVFIGLSLLSRPDFVLWAVPALLYLLFRNFKEGVKAGLTALLVTAPWGIFTTIYYGSPVPHTIRAKSLVFGTQPDMGSGLHEWATWIWTSITTTVPSYPRYFSPFLEYEFISSSTSYKALLVIGFIYIALVAVGILKGRARKGLYPAITFFAAYTAYRIFLLPNFAWYLPPYMAVGAVLAALGLQHLYSALPRPAAVLAVVMGLAFAIHMPFTFPLEAKVQADIEANVRRPLAEYMHTAVKKGEAVVSESSGYVGYYSRVLLYDFPGLTSPTSLRVLKQVPKNKRSMYYLIHSVEPDWVVLRPFELANLNRLYPGTVEKYMAIRHYKVQVELNRWGIGIFNPDMEFYILRKKA